MLRVLSQTAVILALVTALGAAPGNKTPDSQEGPQPVRDKVRPVKSDKPQVGKASWYGRFFQHKQTASGEPYDMYQVTAAHRTLPLGSWVRVTNLKNSLAVVVRINDRGPMPKGRIIDLSYGAAQMIGFKSAGIQPVRVDVIQPVTLARVQDLQ